MNSKERHQIRYERRKAKRKSKDISFGDVFTFDNMYESYRKTINGVRFKASTQSYIMYSTNNIHNTMKLLNDGKYKSSGFFEFDINERGKQRHIKSVKIEERVVQKCLCDYFLMPLFKNKLIYDNGASLKGKGYSFTVDRFNRKLTKLLKHNNDGYILLFDFKKYFDNISHEVVFRIFDKYIKDKDLNRLSKHFIEMFGDVGVGLGSQISQLVALVCANELDHLIEDELKLPYGRYMDDGYLLSNSKEELVRCLDLIKAKCNELGITLNEKKTQIIKISHGFTFLKMRITITKNRKIIRKICRDSIKRERKKLKKIYENYKLGKLTLCDCYNTFFSWVGYAKRFNCRRTIYNMVLAFAELFNLEVKKCITKFC